MSKKPNVLVFFTDQQRYDTIHAAGYPHMVTPNLDRLAREGTIFRNAYSSNPVCLAARHDLLTGLSGRYHGYFRNANQPIKDYSLPTLPGIFSEAGYRTAAIGKMHFIPTREHHGFGELHLNEEIPDYRQNDQYAMYLEKQGLEVQNLNGVRAHIYHIPQNSQMDLAHHPTTWVGDRTVEWLKENGEAPFFLFASWIQPHPPWALPKEYQGLYRDISLPAPVPVSRNYPFTTEFSEWYGDGDSEEEKRKIRDAYFSSIAMVDHNIGRILDYLEQTGKLEDTLVIFMSDHGEMLQDKGHYTKMVPYEGSVRIPLIIRYPGRFNRGSVREEFVNTFDIMPTCLDICGLAYPDSRFELTGESLCTGIPRKDRELIHAYYGNPEDSGVGIERWVMARDGRYKYIYWYNNGTEEMYDLQKDPGETCNLINTGDYPEEAYIRLKQSAAAYEERQGPEDMIVDGCFKVIEGSSFAPNYCSKFTHFCNKQFHYNDRRSNEERGQTFIREIRYALRNEEYSGKKLEEVFNDPVWKKDFLDNWSKFGEGEDILKLMFKGEAQ